MEIKDNERLRQHYQRAVIIAMGMIGSIAIYVAVAEFLLAGRMFGIVTGEDFPQQGLRVGAVVLAFILLSLATIVRRRLLEGNVSMDVLVTQALVPQERYASMLKATVVTLALCDGVALLGFVLFLFSGERADLYGFSVAAIAASWFHFPRYGQWQHWFSRRSRIR